MDVLTIQSHVARGHVGLNAATLPLQLLGFEVDAIPTAVFSNHLGRADFTGRALDPEWVRDLVDGVAARGLGRCRALLTGFIGDEALGETALHALDRLRAANPDAIYACDPVMGNENGFFVPPGLPEYMRDRLAPRADILFPNHMELEFLAGGGVSTIAEALEAAREVRAMGPGVVAVTSLEARAGFPDDVPALVSGPDGAWLARVPRLDVPADGAGDLTAAVFTAASLRGAAPAEALAHAVGATHGVLRRTAELGLSDLALVAARGEIERPTAPATVVPLGRGGRAGARQARAAERGAEESPSPYRVGEGRGDG